MTLQLGVNFMEKHTTHKIPFLPELPGSTEKAELSQQANKLQKGGATFLGDTSTPNSWNPPAVTSRHKSTHTISSLCGDGSVQRIQQEI